MLGEREVAVKLHYFVFFLSLITSSVLLSTPCAGQSSNCVVIEKRGTSEIVVSCPDGSRVVDAGGRTDLYRVGDRIDIYGMPTNQPGSLPGRGTTPPGR